MNKKGMITQIIAAFVFILIGFSMMPTIIEKVKEAQPSIGDNPISKAMLEVLPLFYALSVLIGAIMMIISALRKNDEYNEEIEEEPEPKPKSKPKKQTYEEYVKERLTVEREMK